MAELREPLLITVRLAAEDPRYIDLRRNVLAKLERVVPCLDVRLATTGQSVVGSTSDEAYGEIDYSYAERTGKTRSTSPREILPVLSRWRTPVPPPSAGADYPGHPLVANAQAALLWFCGALPLLIVLAWRWLRRAPPIAEFLKDGDQP